MGEDRNAGARRQGSRHLTAGRGAGQPAPGRRSRRNPPPSHLTPLPRPPPHRGRSAGNTRPAGGSAPRRSCRPAPRRGQRGAARGLAHLLARQPEHLRRRRRHGRTVRAPRRRAYLRPAPGPALRPPRAPPCASPHRLTGARSFGPAHHGAASAFRLAPALRPAWRHAPRGQPEGARGRRPQPHRPSGRRRSRAVLRPAFLGSPAQGRGGITPPF